MLPAVSVNVYSVVGQFVSTCTIPVLLPPMVYAKGNQ